MLSSVWSSKSLFLLNQDYSWQAQLGSQDGFDITEKNRKFFLIRKETQFECTIKDYGARYFSWLAKKKTYLVIWLTLFHLKWLIIFFLGIPFFTSLSETNWHDSVLICLSVYSTRKKRRFLIFYFLKMFKRKVCFAIFQRYFLFQLSWQNFR